MRLSSPMDPDFAPRLSILFNHLLLNKIRGCCSSLFIALRFRAWQRISFVFILTQKTTTTYDSRYVTATETFLNETYVKNSPATTPY
jgi:hypothetical protein